MKENILNKIATRTKYNHDEETCLKLEVADTRLERYTLRTQSMTFIMRNITSVLMVFIEGGI